MSTLTLVRIAEATGTMFCPQFVPGQGTSIAATLLSPALRQRPARLRRWTRRTSAWTPLTTRTVS